jgi:hypothetical protein
VQAAEQRQKLLLEVQDLRAQLEGWSDNATMRKSLGELRDPSLFPPQDPSLQRRAEVTVEILQEEVRPASYCQNGPQHCTRCIVTYSRAPCRAAVKCASMLLVAPSFLCSAMWALATFFAFLLCEQCASML